MSTERFRNFDTAVRVIKWDLSSADEVNVGRWQGISTVDKPDLVTRELQDVSFTVRIPHSLEALQAELKPNLPWADDHFEERVSRVPSNPGEQYKNWPWWHGQVDETLTYSKHHEPGQFTHTYQERFWPKHAHHWDNRKGKCIGGEGCPGKAWRGSGIRYGWGDLDDLVQLLLREPYTRQAYLPIFFPEDTGAVHGGRTPCTLGYHFMLRDGKLSVKYLIRSCDFVRHFRDDVYLACRLLLWVLDELKEVELRSDHKQVWVDVNAGDFTMFCSSLHYHKGDQEHFIGI